MAALAESNKSDIVTLTDSCKRQLNFWWLLLRACNGKLSIPGKLSPLPATALHAHCDAAGGTLDTPGRGSGGVCGNAWFYVPWSKAINSGAHRIEGKKVGRKLSALELVGPLVFLAAMPEQFRGQSVNIWIDNAGSVGVWRKGYSTHCKLCTTLVTAISAVAAGIGAIVDIRKVTRCSEAAAVMADHLSKAQFSSCRAVAQRHAWVLNAEPARIPATLLSWLQLPVPDDQLGHKILRELAGAHNVLGYSATTSDVFL